jgi:gamma-glutamyl:cysteine ligase YbdK (ATP-grasp superfamily)
VNLRAKLQLWICGDLSHVHSFAELIHADAKRMGKPDDNLDSGIANAALDAAQVRAVEVGFFGQFVLGQPGVITQMGNVTPELYEC